MSVFYTYIMTNESRSHFYIGLTPELKESVHRHRLKPVRRYPDPVLLDRLVFHQRFDSLPDALNSEKCIRELGQKGLVDFIETENPYWEDLSEQISGLNVHELLKSLCLN